MMTRGEFERLVERLMGEIPEPFRDRFDNLVFLIEDYADQEILAEAGFGSDEELLGFYRGQPLNERLHDTLSSGPDLIYLFQRSIEAEARATGLPVSQVVRETLIHEVAHFFGFSEEEMDRIEALWASGGA